MFLRPENDRRSGHPIGNQVVRGAVGRSAVALLAGGLAMLARWVFHAPEPVVWGIAIVALVGGWVGVEWYLRRLSRQRGDQAEE